MDQSDKRKGQSKKRRRQRILGLQDINQRVPNKNDFKLDLLLILEVQFRP